MPRLFRTFAVNFNTLYLIALTYQNQTLVILQLFCHYFDLLYFIVITMLPLGGP